MTKKQKLAQMRAEKYAQEQAAAEQAAVEQAEREMAPFMLEKIEQEIQDTHGIYPPFDRKTLANELPWYIFSQWDRYNDIVNPEPEEYDADSEINTNIDTGANTNGFGIDFGKSVKSEPELNFSAEDIHNLEFQEEPQVPDDVPSSVRSRDLPRGWLNVCDPNDDYSFDEMDDEDDDIANTGYDYGDS